MKKFSALIITCLFTISVFGQSSEYGGTLRTQVNGNSVIIKLDSTWRNCGADYDQQVFFISNTITWLQVDRGASYGCDCLFNYLVTLDSLNPGIYTVVVYFTESCFAGFDSSWNYIWVPCDTTFEGATTFTIQDHLAANPVKTGDSASWCLIDRIIEHPKDKTVPYPNPTFNIINIPFTGRLESVELSDIMGHTVKCTVIKISDNRVTLDLTDMPGGIYYCKNSGKVFKVIKL
jgi:hypothetical protein